MLKQFISRAAYQFEKQLWTCKQTQIINMVIVRATLRQTLASADLEHQMMLTLGIFSSFDCNLESECQRPPTTGSSLELDNVGSANKHVSKIATDSVNLPTQIMRAKIPTSAAFRETFYLDKLFTLSNHP